MSSRQLVRSSGCWWKCINARNAINTQFTTNRVVSLGGCDGGQRRFLNLQEYQSKQIMADNGIHVQRFRVIDSLDAAKKVVDGSGSGSLDCAEYVIKAQVLAGGRGKGHFKKSSMKGGVQLTKDKKKASEIASKMLNDYLITEQTTKDGVLVSKVMIAEALDIKQELYLAILLDRAQGGPVMVACQSGGMDIEKVAHTNPSAIHKFPISIATNELSRELATKVARDGLGLTDQKLVDLTVIEVQNLYKMFLQIDATQIEINPLGVTTDDQIVCFDAKIQFDENASFRQKWISAIEKENANLDEDPRDQLARDYNLNFVPMTGNIACLVNGAGLAMATMDIIHHYGGEPANFLDVGGSVNQQGVENAFKLVTQDPKVKAILVNIFGGIVNCETIAKGLIAARSLVNVPLVVRLEGTNQESAKKLLQNVPDIITATDLDDAARKAVEMAGKK